MLKNVQEIYSHTFIGRCIIYFYCRHSRCLHRESPQPQIP
nr:MAG TPA: hypothetical protein [Caudoviricetes sp.]